MFYLLFSIGTSDFVLVDPFLIELHGISWKLVGLDFCETAWRLFIVFRMVSDFIGTTHEFDGFG
jgi:hypothetical protein